MNKNEIEFEDFVDELFYKDPQNPMSIQLELENENKDSEFIFKNCLEIFRRGMVIKFGNNNKVDLDSITLNQFGLINQYFQSFGINVYYKINPTEYEMTNYIPVDKRDLKDHFMIFHTNKKTYKISFDYFR